MLALRSFQGPDELPERYRRNAQPQLADWLSIQHAACELGVSVTTVRRMIREGRLSSRAVPRRGGFTYVVHLPNSRHAEMNPRDNHDDRLHLRLIPPSDAIALPAEAARDREFLLRETQVQHLSEALSRALRLKQRALPVGIGDPSERLIDPYARYRWLVRRRWWWPF